MIPQILMGLGGAAIPWLMRNPKVAQTAGKLLPKKVFTPGTPTKGYKWGPHGTKVEGTPPGGALGWVANNPIKSSLGLGYGGTVAGSMMAGSPDEPTPSPRGGVPLPVPGGVPAGPPADDFTSNLPSYAERASANRRKMFNNMSTILKQLRLQKRCSAQAVTGWVH